MDSRFGLSLDEFRPSQGGAAVALGFFDGVHRGHQAILRTARELARTKGLDPIAFTFSNHPATVLAPERAPDLLTDRAERFALIERLGLRVVWMDFQPDFSRTEAAEFARSFLQERLRARVVSVGPNYRFGHGARGDGALLASLAHDLGFEVVQVPGLESGGALVSSSRIRRLVRHGRMEEAAAALGRPYRVLGPVEAGDSRGAHLGTRTANLRIPEGRVIPATGVYAVWAGCLGNLRPGVANFGVRPTFGGGVPVLEVHLLDFSADLYGRPLEVFLVSRLRDERRFPQAEDLQAQIGLDVALARAILARSSKPESLVRLG